MASQKHNITLADVAKAAGVSSMTVSRVLNKNRDAVKPSTYEKVEKAIRELNYAPNISARALAGTRSFRIGVVYPSASPFSFYLDSLVVNVADALADVGMYLSVVKIDVSLERDAKINRLSEMSSDLDGFLVPPPIADDQDVRAFLESAAKPYVLLTGETGVDGAIRVCIDNFEAAREVTQYLIDRGHQKIAFISGGANFDSAERERGYRYAMQLAKYRVEPQYVSHGEFTYESGLVAAEELLAIERRPTAIFAGNDEMALASIYVANKRRIRVPEELSIIGFDGSPLAHCATPKLTSVSQQLGVMARCAVKELNNRLGNSMAVSNANSTGKQILVPYEFVAGESVSKPRLGKA
nr:LacI family DNA-binding transcriptional regulator [Hyphomonas sp. Mor2]